ncbi:hypothetical protein ET996_09840 [Propioniciclava tarda]|uniref:ResB-like domain-containing protein n=1 Tax=Propioniciclava tarda TaxID=433330 RepID=A0A4Q9KJ98_PROTD|nr:hypothetical protein ET996_09840 [Propioniciclava tarda]
MTTPVKDGAEVTGSVPGHVDAVDVLDGGRRPSAEGVSILGRVWGFFIAMRTGLFIILILGLLTLIGTVIGQVSEEVLADPVAYQQWFEAGPRQKFGGWATVFDALGLFHVFSAWYFRALFATLAVSILACSVNRAPRLWRVATKPRTSMNDAFFAAAPLKAEFVLPVGVDAAVERVKAGFAQEHFRVLDGSKKSRCGCVRGQVPLGPLRHGGGPPQLLDHPGRVRRLRDLRFQRQPGHRADRRPRGRGARHRADRDGDVVPGQLLRQRLAEGLRVRSRRDQGGRPSGPAGDPGQHAADRGRRLVPSGVLRGGR